MGIEKLLDKYHSINDTECFINGLLAAQAICAKYIVTLVHEKDVEAVAGIMQEILQLMEKATERTKLD